MTVENLQKLLAEAIVNVCCLSCGFDNPIRLNESNPFMCSGCKQYTDWSINAEQIHAILTNAFTPAIKAVADDVNRENNLICVVNTQNFSVSVHKNDFLEYVSLVVMNNETLHARHLESLIEALTMLLMEYERFKKRKNSIKLPSIDSGDYGDWWITDE